MEVNFNCVEVKLTIQNKKIQWPLEFLSFLFQVPFDEILLMKITTSTIAAGILNLIVSKEVILKIQLKLAFALLLI